MEFSLSDYTITKDSLEKVLNFLPYPFLIAELRNGLYHNIHINEKFEKEIGYTCAAIPTVNEWFALAYPDEQYRKEVRTNWNERFEAAKKQGIDSVFMRVVIQTRSNGEMWYEVKSRTFGEFLLVAFINIHDVVMKERELTALNENNHQVLSVLSHDLRAPVVSLHGLTSLAMKEDLSKDEFTSLIHSLHEKTGKHWICLIQHCTGRDPTLKKFSQYWSLLISVPLPKVSSTFMKAPLQRRDFTFS